MTCRVTELNVTCADLAASMRFYCGVLGFRLVEREEACLRLELEGTTLLLVPRHPDTRSSITFDLGTADVAAVAEQAAELGVPVTWRTYKDFKFFSVKDPDGNELEVIQDRGAEAKSDSAPSA